MDRVFARGFACEARGGETRRLLRRKQCVLITLSGSPMSSLRETGEWRAIDVLQDAHVLRSSGLELRKHLHVKSVASPITPETIAANIACRRLRPQAL